jgi:3-methyladenine DNA glycosylase Tag
MVAFAKIRKAALARHGEADLKSRMPAVKSPAALKKIPDDRYFSQMSLRIFRAGLNHSVVDGKWPAFEGVFHGFDPRR